MSKRVDKVIAKVVEYFSKLHGVAALVLVGSQVKGNSFPADKYSDIELYVVAFDREYNKVEKEVQSTQGLFGDKVVLAYKNQWAGWSILFDDLLRLELPMVKSSDLSAFSRSAMQKIKILYSNPNFKIDNKGVENKKRKFISPSIDESIKDFWYMAVYAAQHIGRGEIWLARDAIRISMQGKIKRLIQEIYHKETLQLDRDRRLELTWSEKELEVLRKTSSTYDREDVIRAFWENIKDIETLLTKLDEGKDLFKKYKYRLLPVIKSIVVPDK